MRAANEVFFNDAMNGTSLGTFTASRTLFIVNNCEIVLNVDSIEWAFLFAELATYAASFTKGFCDFALITGRASDDYS